MIAWCFHSPKRLFLVVATAAALVIGTGIAVQAVRSGSQRSSAEPSVPVGVPADTRPAVEAARTFAARWAAGPTGQTAEQWRAGLAPLVTHELEGGLQKTDPATLPGGAPEGEPVIRFFSVSSAMIQVPLSSGRPVLVTVVFSQGRWLTSDIQPFAGNAGDEPLGSPSGAVSSGASGG